MPEHRRPNLVLGVGGVLGGLALAAGVAWIFLGGKGPEAPDRAPAATDRVAGAAEVGPDSPLPALADGLEQGDGMALAVLVRRMTPTEEEAEVPPAPIPADEAAAWGEVVAGLRDGFEKFSPYGRASAVSALGQVLDRFEIEPVPADWAGVFGPSYDVLAAAMGDPDPAVRVAALQVVASLWTWAPGFSLRDAQLQYIATTKENLHREASRLLGDADAGVRAIAVSCLAALPLDERARPAAAGIKDADATVRLATLSGFAGRPEVLDSEAILPLLFDRDVRVMEAAEAVLKHRGLTPDLIGLGKMAVHPRVEIRISTIERIKERPDVDPVIWLVFLSKDADPSVRAKAVEAMAELDAPQARARLAEMAASDADPAVRAAAAKVAPTTTAALPPLPGSPSLNPKAN